MSLWGNPVLIGEREIVPEPPLPAEYQEVEYMDFTPHCGFQVTIPTSFKLEIKAAPDVVADDKCAFGYRASSSRQTDFEVVTDSAGYMALWTRGTSSDSNLRVDCVAGEPVVVKAFAYGFRTTAFIGRYSTYSSAYYGFDGKIYYIKGWDVDMTLSFKFVPCYRKADSVPGWYDVVADVFYSTLNTTGGGSISLGPDVT